jgi:Rrf2 family iron-sulfur cluster assembly transcriptional regulator
MKLSTKGRYAVMALAELARQANEAGDDAPVSLAQIAAGQQISLEYLEQLFAKLRRAALVESVRGPGGGYRLARDPDSIRVSEIILAVDEPLRVTRCTGDAIDGCVGGEKCVTHELWAALGRHIYGFLSSVTLGDVVNRRNFALEMSVRRAMAAPGAVRAVEH